MKKKNLVMLLGMVTVLGLAAGCGSQTQESTEDEQTVGETEENQEQEEAAQEEQGARTADISTLAPKLNSAVMGAYTSLGFTVTIDPSVSYSGYFNARNQSITLKKEGDTVYHEMGHFLAFVAGNVDKKAEFTAVYNEEKESTPEPIRVM